LIGKEQELEQMREKGTLKETAAWIKTQIGTFLSLLSELKGLFTAAWDAIQPQNLPNLATNLRNLVTQATGFLKRVWTFAVTVAVKVLELIKKVLLGWLSQHAAKTPGYFLLTVVLGKDIFSQQVVPRSVTNIIKGFITLLPNGEQQYKQMEETGVIARAAGRIEALMSQLGITWAFVRDLFLGIWNKLSIESLIQPIATFIQIVSLFKEPILRLLKFTIEVIKIVLDLVLQLMNFPPGIVGRIINNAMQAFEDIKKNPVGFLLNLLKAVKTGFLKFFDNILKHLLSGVKDWLFSQLAKTSIEVPKDFTLESVLKLVFKVLDITMEKMWKKLADRIGQPAVDKIRGAIDKLVGIWNFVKDVQQRGMAAIWEYIQGQISNLWDTVLGFVRDWIMKKIVDKVVTKLLSMLDPTGIMAVVNSFIAFFNAVQSAIEYFRQILEIIDSFVGTVAEIATGNVDRAAQFLENLLARSLPVAIGFLANQVGLGNVGEKIQEIIAGVREMVDKALDWLVDQAVKLGKAALNALGLGKKDESPHAALANQAKEELKKVEGEPKDYDKLRAEKETQASIELPRLGITINRESPTKIPVGLQPSQKITIGVPSKYWPRIGKKMQYLAEERGSAVEQVKAVLDYYGLNQFGVQMDHVQDLQFGGPDEPQNIWPYDSSANMSAGPRQRDQQVTYLDEQGNTKQAKTNELPGRWFVIVEIGL